LPFSQCTAALFLLQSIRFEAIVAVGGAIAASMLLLLQLGLMQLLLLGLLQYLLLILLLLFLSSSSSRRSRGHDPLRQLDSHLAAFPFE